ncbi:hypothetical protein PC116_g1682 [Phytophthora cactorum]|uniref:Uncharacterized protein n=1 Tax=Phytophthora cactorum TaxID=29920 RepID=A0A8T1GMF6_9STRA|nr:hypothetical protein PC112_g11579 [Phytophthora cactorum]KAG2934430.1 hypothetical protein PC114_g956 [Phytophthora cactorum]KAG2944148.1 hypothetical protein PC115_g449 [Phytophthora cactorum]KAG3000027.1 hypothetical protein PC118_g522 [Phytophthora cactorum]KAG3017132.1 hypothetical protein PC120_g11189 [Phytophthora cactorum]
MDPSDTSYSSHSRRPQEPSPPSKTTSTSSRLFVLCATLAAAALLVSFIFYSIHEGHSRNSVYLLQGCLAIALLEKSWWHYRIRQRFLAPLEASVAALFGGADPERPRPDPSEYECELRDRMEPKTYAVTKFTDRYMKEVRGAAVAVALVAASTVAAVGTIIAVYTEDTVLVCAAGALTVTAMNAMIAHYTGSETQMAILDYLFVALAGWVIIVISRIVASKKLVECFLMVTLDTIALLHVTVIMMEVVDFVEHPLANNLPGELASFFVTIACAELGHYMFDLVTTEWLSRCFRRWRHISPRVYGATDFVVSVIFGAGGMLVWMQWVFETDTTAWNVVALLGAAALSQVGRSFMTLIHETAMAPPWNRTTFTIWNNGIMELMNPFLVGWIVFHPYAKTILEAEGGY